jgi:hypothetical protein
MPASRGRGAGRVAGAGLAKPKRRVTKKKKAKGEPVHAPRSGVKLCGCKVGASTCAKPEGHAAREKENGASTQHRSWEGAKNNLAALSLQHSSRPVKILAAPNQAAASVEVMSDRNGLADILKTLANSREYVKIVLKRDPVTSTAASVAPRQQGLDGWKTAPILEMHGRQEGKPADFLEDTKGSYQVEACLSLHKQQLNNGEFETAYVGFRADGTRIASHDIARSSDDPVGSHDPLGPYNRALGFVFRHLDMRYAFILMEKAGLTVFAPWVYFLRILSQDCRASRHIPAYRRPPPTARQAFPSRARPLSPAFGHLSRLEDAEPRVRPRASLRGGLRPRIERGTSTFGFRERNRPIGLDP